VVPDPATSSVDTTFAAIDPAQLSRPPLAAALAASRVPRTTAVPLFATRGCEAITRPQVEKPHL
jgi:hypothetical protein